MAITILDRWFSPAPDSAVADALRCGRSPWQDAVHLLCSAWLFMTPIAYPSSLLSEPWHTLYGLNPMAGVVEGFRWALLGTDTAPGPMTLVSAVMAILIFIGGAFYFRRMEDSFADVL